MRVKHFNGTVVDVPNKKANTLVSGGSWTFVDAPAEKLSETVESAPQGDDTEEDVQEPVEASEDQEEVSEVATIPEMREWARANGVQNVPAKGKLPRHAVEAYMNAHKE
jgi:hypothetical protein